MAAAAPRGKGKEDSSAGEGKRAQLHVNTTSCLEMHKEQHKKRDTTARQPNPLLFFQVEGKKKIAVHEPLIPAVRPDEAGGASQPTTESVLISDTRRLSPACLPASLSSPTWGQIGGRCSVVQLQSPPPRTPPSCRPTLARVPSLWKTPGLMPVPGRCDGGAAAVTQTKRCVQLVCFRPASLSASAPNNQD